MVLPCMLTRVRSACRLSHAVTMAAEELAALYETLAGCAEAQHALPLVMQGYLDMLWTAPATSTGTAVATSKLPATSTPRATHSSFAFDIQCDASLCPHLRLSAYDAA